MKPNQCKTVIILTTTAILLLSNGVACSQKSDADSAPSEAAAESREDALPDGFPDAVPVYQPNSVTSVNQTQTANQAMYVVGFMTESSKDEVVAFYEDELSSNGWSVNPVSSDDRFSATNGELTITVSVMKAGNSSVFTITAPGE